MTITERWTIVADFVTRMVALSIHTICLLLVGALMGAWIVHLTESPQVQEEHGLVVELGKRLNLCLVNRQEQNGLTAELGERLRVCLVNRVEGLAKAKAAGVNLSDMPSPPGTPSK